MGASGQTSIELQSTSAERRPRGGSYDQLPARFRGRGPGAFPFALDRAPLRVRGLAGRAEGRGGGGARPGGCACGLPAGVRMPCIGALRPGGVAVEGGLQRADLQGSAVRRAAAVGQPGQGSAAGRLRLWPACGGAGAAPGGASTGGICRRGGSCGQT